jgi:hypothetical protein
MANETQTISLEQILRMYKPCMTSNHIEEIDEAVRQIADVLSEVLPGEYSPRLILPILYGAGLPYEIRGVNGDTHIALGEHGELQLLQNHI